MVAAATVGHDSDLVDLDDCEVTDLTVTGTLDMSSATSVVIPTSIGTLTLTP